LEDRGSHNDKISRGIWEAVEAGTRKVGLGKTEERRSKGGSRKEKEKKRKQKKGRTVEVRKVTEKWEIWDEKEEVAKSEEEAKKLVPENFHRWIKMFEKKQSERMPTRKL